jgi:hypothetical protein
MSREWTRPSRLLAATLTGGTGTALAGFWVHLLIDVTHGVGGYATIACVFFGPLTAAWIYNWLDERADRDHEPDSGSDLETVPASTAAAAGGLPPVEIRSMPTLWCDSYGR